MTSTVFLTIIVCVLLAALICTSALLFKLAADHTRALERAHQRTTDYTESLVDRIMSMDWNTYKAYDLMKDTDNTGFIDPEPEPEVPVDSRHRGFGSSLGLARPEPEIDEAGMTAELPT